jgi:hypothetical protein
VVWTVAFSGLAVASVRDVDAVVEAVPSIIVDSPTVIAPSDGDSDALLSLESLWGKSVPVGEGSTDGWSPVLPTLERASPDAERVGRVAVELTVGDAASDGRLPPVAPTKGLVAVLDELELESDSVSELPRVGWATSLGI